MRALLPPLRKALWHIARGQYGQFGQAGFIETDHDKPLSHIADGQYGQYGQAKYV